MIKKITWMFNPKWLMSIKPEAKQPAQCLKDFLVGHPFEIKIEEESLDGLVIKVEEQYDTDKLISEAVDLLNTYYECKLTLEEYGIMTETIEEKPELVIPSRADEIKRMLEELSDLSDEDDEDDEDEAETEQEEGQEEKMALVQEKIDGLVGATEFKALIQELQKVLKVTKIQNTQEVFLSQSYLFSIGDGCGLSTYLSVLSEMIDASGAISICEDRTIQEIKLDPYDPKDEDDLYETARSLTRGIAEDEVQIICFDMSVWIDHVDSNAFRKFLYELVKKSKNFIYVFRLPFVDKDVIERVKSSLNDLLYVKTATFPPFTNEEIAVCAEKEFKNYGYALESDAWEFFQQRILEEKGDGRFYGLNTVKKVVKEFIYKKQLLSGASDERDLVVSSLEARSFCNRAFESEEGIKQLIKLVGYENIKEKIDEMVAQIEIAIKTKGAERPCIHMRFVGNPGTGKTTVARIVGKILKEKGILRIGNFYEHGGRDFCGRYIGETAPKTAAICRDAYGSVLFIDEAYSLFRGDNDSRDFGREAIDTLIAEMENHRDDFVIIMAGYPDDMEKLMTANSGLRSRMPYMIEFPNFTREQLEQIFISMVNGRFETDEQIFEVAHNYFANLSDEILQSKEFSNARFVRNLYERTWAKAAMRCQLAGADAVVLTKADFELASNEKEFNLNTRKKTRIGFYNN